MVRFILVAGLAVAAFAAPANGQRASSPSPSLFAGYPAVDYLSKSAPAFSKPHRSEIAEALLHASAANKKRLRYTMAYLSSSYPKVFVIFLDVGQPTQPGLSRYYVIVNMRNGNYDPKTNTVVPQPSPQFTPRVRR
ncbi:MAG TPA: hypothetical protein VMV65_02220 [Alphaproteobacteria bacterium]|nr:hypothetical protein [Alphaproteobacteria bacterium]